MLVFWKQRIVFLAVPKTGTTALEQALLPHASAAILHPPGQKHVNLMGYRNRLSKFFEQRGDRPMRTVAVMREPIDWLGSWYRYRSRPDNSNPEKSTSGMSFDDFVLAWLSEDQPELARVGSQARFLSDRDGAAGIDHLFRYDQQDALIRFFEDKLGTSLELGRENVSPRKTLTLSPDVEARLREEARAEFDLWERLCAT